ncbi:MAG: PAS domain-containing protein [Mycobacterium sp.]
MVHDWLLVETLGSEPTVVAQGRRLENLVPVAQFLRRSPQLTAIQMAIAESVRTEQSLASITPKKNARVIRTEPVLMSDGRMHGVHVWSGPADVDPQERPIPGPMKWDLTLGVATETPESLANSGKDPEVEATHGRAFAEELPARDFNPDESKLLAATIRPEPGQFICNSWDITDFHGVMIRVGFVARTAWEATPGGRDHLVARGMNWRGQLDGAVQQPELLTQQALHGLAQPGVHRVVVDIRDWRPLKWLDDPCPFYDWRGSVDTPRVHPDDEALISRMTAEFVNGPTSGILRMRQPGGGWAPVHVTVNRIELEEGVFAGLVALRLPADDELTDARLSETEDGG